MKGGSTIDSWLGVSVLLWTLPFRGGQSLAQRGEGEVSSHPTVREPSQILAQDCDGARYPLDAHAPRDEFLALQSAHRRFDRGRIDSQNPCERALAGKGRDLEMAAHD